MRSATRDPLNNPTRVSPTDPSWLLIDCLRLWSEISDLQWRIWLHSPLFLVWVERLRSADRLQGKTSPTSNRKHRAVWWRKGAALTGSTGGLRWDKQSIDPEAARTGRTQSALTHRGFGKNLGDPSTARSPNYSSVFILSCFTRYKQFPGENGWLDMILSSLFQRDRIMKLL